MSRRSSRRASCRCSAAFPRCAASRCRTARGSPTAARRRRQSVRQLLIDVRSLLGRVGTLGTLLGPQGEMAGCRVAVLDVSDNDPYYVFSENAARMRGRELRYFYDPAAALHWLRATTAD